MAANCMHTERYAKSYDIVYIALVEFTIWRQSALEQTRSCTLHQPSHGVLHVTLKSVGWVEDDDEDAIKKENLRKEDTIVEDNNETELAPTPTGLSSNWHNWSV